MTVVNALTIDVEDYFHIHAFSDVVKPEDWDSFEPRIERNTYRLLDLLDSVEVQGSGVRSQGSEGRRQTTEDGRQNSESRIQNPESRQTRATFFVLGWVAERYPTLVEEIHDRGHEVACHGYMHQRISSQTQEEFKEDVKRSKGILEHLIGAEVIGYRAPTYSINKDTIWALEILFELGFRYDSSIFPIKHDFYGFPEAPRFPFFIDFTNGDLLTQFRNPKYLYNTGNFIQTNYQESNNPMPYALCSMRDLDRDRFIEFPIPTINVLGRNLPCSGGGYFRLFPYWYTKWAFRKLNNNASNPAVFYLHPWELDTETPIISRASSLSKFRTYVNLKSTKRKFARLSRDFKFVPLRVFI